MGWVWGRGRVGTEDGVGAGDENEMGVGEEVGGARGVKLGLAMVILALGLEVGMIFGLEILAMG